MGDQDIVWQGAEARIYRTNFFGRPTLIKTRFVKTYRHPDLDSAISRERLRAESRGLLRCKSAGVRSPTVYHVREETRSIYMEEIHGPTARERINDLILSNKSDRNECLDDIATSIGACIAKIHKANLIHGDLTTSNMILAANGLYLIDFGLSKVSNSAEDKGVDLYVLERAVLSSHPESDDFFGKMLRAYQNEYSSGVKEVMSKYREVKARGRKRTMVG